MKIKNKIFSNIYLIIFTTIFFMIMLGRVKASARRPELKVSNPTPDTLIEDNYVGALVRHTPHITTNMSFLELDDQRPTNPMIYQNKQSFKDRLYRE